MDNTLLHLLQITDSNFPSGSFSHTFGLETYMQEGIITNSTSFFMAVKQFLCTQFIYTDGFACRLAFESMKKKEYQKLWEIDQELFALANAKEAREGNKKIGKQLLRVMNQLYDFPLLKLYKEKEQEKTVHGHSAIVFAIVCEGLQIDIESTLSVYLFSTATSIVQNGVRGIPIGQTDGQKMLQELQPFLHTQVAKILTLSEEEFGGTAPGLEIAQMRHENLPIRLFMS